MTNPEYVTSLENRIAELEGIVSSFKKKMYIPTIGSVIELSKDWTFGLFEEYRNCDLFEKLFGEKFDWSAKEKVKDVTFPKGTQLKVKRIYVRQGKEEYDSVTFSIVKHTVIKKLKGKFWCKLNDVNKLEFDLIDGRGKIGD